MPQRPSFTPWAYRSTPTAVLPYTQCLNRRLHDSNARSRTSSARGRRQGKRKSDARRNSSYAKTNRLHAIFQHLAGQEAVRTKYEFSNPRFSDNSCEITQVSGNEMSERRLRTGPNKRAASEQRVKPRPQTPTELGSEHGLVEMKV